MIEFWLIPAIASVLILCTCLRDPYAAEVPRASIVIGIIMVAFTWSMFIAGRYSVAASDRGETFSRAAFSTSRLARPRIPFRGVHPAGLVAGRCAKTPAGAVVVARGV